MFFFLLVHFHINAQVRVGHDWIKMAVSGNKCLPCLLCIAAHSGLEVTDWRSATLSHDHLSTHLHGRLGQHLGRTHDMTGDEDFVKELKARGKSLLCMLLHQPAVAANFPPLEVIR